VDREIAIKRHLQTKPRAEESKCRINRMSERQDSGRASLGCGLLSVRREAANRVTIYCWYQRWCGAVGWCEEEVCVCVCVRERERERERRVERRVERAATHPGEVASSAMHCASATSAATAAASSVGNATAPCCASERDRRQREREREGSGYTWASGHRPHGARHRDAHARNT
jgi:hypothetical protein